MTSEKRGSSDTPAGARRRPPTIDLKATEVASGPVAPDPGPQEQAVPEPEMGAAAAEITEPKATNPAPDSGEPRTSSGARAARLGAFAERLAALRSGVSSGLSSLSSSPSSSLSWPLVGAGVAGAGVMLAFALLLWGFGAFSTRDDLTVTVAARLAILELQVRELAGRPTAVDPKTVGELGSRVGAVEQATRGVDDLNARLGKLETAAAAPRPAAPDSALLDRIIVLEAIVKPLADIARRADEAALAARDAKSRADAAFEAAQKPGRAAPGAIEQGEIDRLSGRITALERSAKAIEDRLAHAAPAAGADPALRVAFLAVALRAAVERGEPYAAELAAAKSLMPDVAALASLELFAATGVPRPQLLGRELVQIAPAMLTAVGATSSREGGIVDRLQANAERLVRIRPINEAPGDDPAAVIARAEVKAGNGDFAGALAELARVPEAGRAPAQAWMKKAAARVAAIATARRLADAAVDALGKPAQ